MDDDTAQGIVNGKSALDDGVSAVDTDMAAAIDAMTWSEGLGLATADVATDFTTNANTSVTGTDGSTTNSRATTYGTWTGGIVEYMFEIDFTTALSADDIVQALLISDGDDNAVAREAITTSAYTTMGASITLNGDGDKYFVDVVFAKAYDNAATVAECQVTRNFGGDICDPSTFEMNVFINVNTVREDPAAFDTNFDAIIASFVPNDSTSLDSSYDFNGDGSNQDRTFVKKQAGVTSAKSTVNGGSALSPLKWSPGLFLAASDHATDMIDAETVTTDGTDGSTPTTRAAVYGSGPIYEIDSTGDNNEVNTVMQMLIGD